MNNQVADQTVRICHGADHIIFGLYSIYVRNGLVTLRKTVNRSTGSATIADRSSPLARGRAENVEAISIAAG